MYKIPVLIWVILQNNITGSLGHFIKALKYLYPQHKAVIVVTATAEQ